jgi:hypothetical protein
MENLCELDLPDRTLFNPIPTAAIKPVEKIRKVEFSQDEKSWLTRPSWLW